MLTHAATIDKLLERLIPLGHHDGPVAIARNRRDLGLGWLYYSLARLLRPNRVVVVGSFRGFSVVCLALGLEDNGRGHLDFVDASKVDRFWLNRSAVRRHFEVFGVADRITVHRMTTDRFLRKSANLSTPIDFLFLDGDHHHSSVRFDHTGFEAALAPDAYVAFHDSYVGGFGFTEWEVADYLSTLDLAAYEVLTFPVGQGLTLLKRLPASRPASRRSRNRQILAALAKRCMSSTDNAETHIAHAALRVMADATALDRSARVRLRFLHKANTDLRRELRKLRHRVDTT
jgi:predicted O-methyltransferase YrrM